MTTSSSNLVLRALLAAGLMIGFYVLSLGLVAILVALPMAEFHETGRVHVRIAFFCWIGAGVILWSIVPRRNSFPDPGPRLLIWEHPALFDLISSVAEKTGQRMPDAVFLVPDANAFVAERGGWFGFRAERIMGLGLPLLRILDESQLEAVLAHEFGHFSAGDTRLGPWIHRTRAAIGRMLQNVSRHSWLLQKPFEWYGKAFLRISHAVSRHQEFAADRLAARVVGSAPLIAGLRLVRAASLSFPAYWTEEVRPVLEAGFLPPLADGFGRFMAAPSVAQALDRAVEQHLAQSRTEPWDTHPSLRDRITALGGDRDAGTADATGSPAIGLISDLAATEAALVRHLVGDSARSLERIEWDSVPGRALASVWKQQALRFGPLLEGVRVEDLPSFSAHLVTRDAALTALAGRPLDPAGRMAVAGIGVGCVLATLLNERGFQAMAQPGEPVSLVGAGVRIEPFAILRRLADREISPEQWRSLTQSLGFAEIDMGAAIAGVSSEIPIAQTPLHADASSKSRPLHTSALWSWWVPLGVLVAGLFGFVAVDDAYQVLNRTPLVSISAIAGVIAVGAYGFSFVGLGRLKRLGILPWYPFLRFLFYYWVAAFFATSALVGLLNGIADPGPEQTRELPVLTAFERSRSWFVQVRDENGVHDLRVDPEVRARLGIGSRVVLRTRPGRLGMEWLVGYEVHP